MRACLPEVTAAELCKLLQKLKKGRTSAADGLIAEMLQMKCAELVLASAGLMTDILDGFPESPSSWKRSEFVVLFKKGNPGLRKNFRPIAIIPILGKLYSSIVLSRVRSHIEELLRVEKAGFRFGMGCSDHLQALRLCAEKAKE